MADRPAPISRRGTPITNAEFEKPWETPMTPLGIKGVNLTVDIEALEPGEYQSLTNGYHRQDFALTTRPGLTALASRAGATNAHSASRMNDALAGSFTRIWGIDTSLYLGQSGALGAAIDSGYSGNPLCILPSRPTLGPGTWAIVADTARVRQVRNDGLVLPLGIAAPATKPTMALQAIDSVAIIQFNSTDGSEAANWTLNSGTDFSDPPQPTGTPLANDGGSDTEFVTNPGTAVEQAANGHWSFWSFPFTRDLSKLASGTTVEDPDFIHLELKLSHPQLTEEVRVYFVCSNNWSDAVLPGTSPSYNTDYYVKAFTQNDFVAFLQSTAGLLAAQQLAAARAANSRASRRSTNEGATGETAILRGTTATRPPGIPPLETESTQLSGSATWREYGVVGRPLRRSDWQREGETAGRDWATITGIVIYLQAAAGTGGPIAVSCFNSYIHGGSGIDSADASAQPYDWRYTNYDTRSGDEGNPSPALTVAEELVAANFIDTARRKVNVTPAAYGSAGVIQRFYRRGGTLNTDWFFDGENAADGAVFAASNSDDAIEEAGTVQIDHYQAIPSVNAAGDTVLAQAVSNYFGPYNGIYFAIGDPNRPGFVAFCLPDAPGHWPATYNSEVSPATEPLVAGCMHGGQPYVFSTERGYVLYPSFGEQIVVTATPTQCRRGLISRTGLCVTSHGICGVAKDGIFRTAGGGPEELISKKIEPLFLNQTKNGYLPIDKAISRAIRLVELADELYFQYQDTGGDRQIWVYNWVGEYWRHYRWVGDEGSCLAVDEGNPQPILVVGGLTTGVFAFHDLDAYGDLGAAIPVTAQTRADDYGRPREDKLLGDQILEVDRQGLTITLQNILNGETVTNPTQVLSTGTDRVQAIFDAFGTTPQHARTVSTILSWSSATARPHLYKLGVSIAPEPDLTINRMTTWDDLGHPDEKYVWGVTLDCDTGGVDRTILIEGDLNGAVTLLATLTVNHDGRHKKAYSWIASNAHLVRIRPTGECVAWMLFRGDWLFSPQPPDIAGWESEFDNGWDQYVTGLDLYVHTYSATKTVEVYVDGTLIQTAAVTTTGRRVVHLTFTPVRGHVLRFVATDANPGTLFSWRWQTTEEPSEQTNFNAQYSPVGTLADKWFKAFILEVDTFGQDKLLDIELDGVVVETLTINTNGRKALHKSLSQQRLGRILRAIPSDANPGRPYQIVPVFDVEPFSLTRWNTQEGDDGIAGLKTWLWGNITLVSTADVVLTLTIQRAQAGAGALDVRTYTIPSTSGVKLERYVPFAAVKGFKRRYDFTSDGSFRLYKEESSIVLIRWGASEPTTTRPFGDDNQDPARDMVNAPLAAARSGGA